MGYVTVYDASGKPFQAPSHDAAQEAVDSGQFFFEKPDTSLASRLGLVEAAANAEGPERDGTDRFYVYDNATGEKISMWAVDARECVQHKSHSWTKSDAEAQMVARANPKPQKPQKAAKSVEPEGDSDKGAEEGDASKDSAAPSGRRTK